MPKLPDYQSSVDKTVMHPSGFKTIELPIGKNKAMVEVKVPRLPLWDVEAGIFARLSSIRTAQWCEQNKARMMSYEEANVLNMSAETLKIQYITVRESEEEKAQRRAEGVSDKQALRNMASLEWCQKWDEKFKAAVLTKGWDIDNYDQYAEMPIISPLCGKLWLSDLNYKMKDGGVNFGFWDILKKDYVQDPGYQHSKGIKGDDIGRGDGEKTGHFDYSQIVSIILL